MTNLLNIIICNFIKKSNRRIYVCKGKKIIDEPLIYGKEKLTDKQIEIDIDGETMAILIIIMSNIKIDN